MNPRTPSPSQRELRARACARARADVGQLQHFLGNLELITFEEELWS